MEKFKSIYNRVIKNVGNLFPMMIMLIVIFQFNSKIYAKSTFSSERIEQAVISIVLEKLQNQAEIEFLTIPKTQEFQQDDIGAEIILDEQIKPGNNIVGLKFLLNGKLLKYLEIHIRVKMLADVWVTSRAIPSNTKLSKNDFVIKSKSINGSSMPLDIEDLIGRELSRTTTQDEYITREMLASEVLVKRGEKVTIVVQSGGIRIRCTGTSVQDGAAGQQIRVKRDGSAAVLTGKVTDDGSVLVYYSNLSMQ